VSQKFIAPGAAIPANDVNFRLRMRQRRAQIMEQIEQTRVQPVDRSSTVIAQKSIEAIHCLWDVIVASPIDQVDLLVGVEMAEPEAILWL